MRETTYFKVRATGMVLALLLNALLAIYIYIQPRQSPLVKVECTRHQRCYIQGESVICADVPPTTWKNGLKVRPRDE